MHKYFEKKNNKNSSWGSKGLYSDKITSAVISYNNRVPELVYDNARRKLRLTGALLKQDKVTDNQGPIVNIYIVYRLIPNSADFNLTVQNCLFGAAELTKNADIDKYKYSGYGIVFDSKGSFAHPNGGYGTNVIVFGVDLSNSTHANKKTRSILVLGKIIYTGNNIQTLYTNRLIYRLEFIQTIQQFMQKKCIHLILLLIIKHFV